MDYLNKPIRGIGYTLTRTLKGNSGPLIRSRAEVRAKKAKGQQPCSRMSLTAFQGAPLMLSIHCVAVISVLAELREPREKRGSQNLRLDRSSRRSLATLALCAL